MENTRDLSDFTFGQLLSHLLATSHLKSYVLASHLNYDVSYISKWVTGSMLPAAKHVNSMCKEIASIILDSSDDTALNDLFLIYPTADRNSLGDAISQSLMAAYQRSNEKKGQSKSLLLSDENNSRTVANPHLQKQYMRFSPPAAGSEAQLNSAEKLGLVMLADLFALSKEDKLHIAKVNADTNFCQYIGELHYLISLSPELADDSFDALLITYLLNNAVGFNLTMSNYKHAPCSLMFVIQNYCIHLSIILQNHRPILSDTSHDKRVINEMYDTLIATEQNFARPLVRDTIMEDITIGKQYLSFVISPNISLFLSRMDEFLLPDDVFEELLEQTDKPEVEKNEIRNLHNLFKTAMGSSRIRIALLDDKLRDYALNGTIDFYGVELTANLDQRERHLKYIMSLLKRKTHSLQIYITNRSYLKDFDSTFMPCIYLSDLFCYIRIAACEERNRAYIIESDELKNIYLRFADYVFQNSGQNAEFSTAQLLNCLNMIRLLKS